MDSLINLGTSFAEHWPVWLVSIVLVVAAVWDGARLRVPNWLTFSLILSGWLYSTVAFGWAGLGWSMAGTLLGFGLLIPVYAVGGMGAGDVKLLAGVGAWVHATHTLKAFCAAGIVGGLLALILVFTRSRWRKHLAQLQCLIVEFWTVRDPEKLAAVAAERKGSMLLLPYGIPIMIGSILYFAWAGMLL
jgi:prepilin peptidase CpaA